MRVADEQVLVVTGGGSGDRIEMQLGPSMRMDDLMVMDGWNNEIAIFYS